MGGNRPSRSERRLIFGRPCAVSLRTALPEAARGASSDLGCGNGATARALAAEVWEVAGIDPSQVGVAHARASGLDLRVGSAYDDLATQFGRWPFVLYLEVVEHVFFPHRLARTLSELCEPGALAIVSTPYHGYWKSSALSLVPGASDRHHHPL